MARLVVPDYPHHITQRGSRRLRTFFRDSDYQSYIKLISKAKESADAEIWAYCLMPNHVHFVVVPHKEDSLAALFSNAHRRYARRINKRNNWQGHLWQERFHSSVLDERHLIAAVRYVELNPVRAQLCKRAEDWHWSSATAHATGKDDLIVNVRPMLDLIPDWRMYLAEGEPTDLLDELRENSRTGLPSGDEGFVGRLEKETGRKLTRGKPGRPKKNGTVTNSSGNR